MNNDSADRMYVTALARGLEVLACFKAGDRELGNAELARRTGLPKATVSRLTYTLCRLGYLGQVKSGRFFPTPAILTLGFAALASLDLRERAIGPMKALSTATGLSVTLGVQQGTRVIYVETHRAPTRVGIRLEVGSVVPIVSTAIGRALYSALPSDARSELVTQLAGEYGPQWPVVSKGLEAAMAHCAVDGFCTSFGEFEPDIYAVSVPIPGSQPPMAVNCSGPAYRLTPEQWRSDIAPQVMVLARSLAVY
jgi:DNA-binding IclR family transcriptional regulator